jgi:hypothetical protein
MRQKAHGGSDEDGRQDGGKAGVVGGHAACIIRPAPI